MSVLNVTAMGGPTGLRHPKHTRSLGVDTGATSALVEDTGVFPPASVPVLGRGDAGGGGGGACLTDPGADFEVVVAANAVKRTGVAAAIAVPDRATNRGLGTGGMGCCVLAIANGLDLT